MITSVLDRWRMLDDWIAAVEKFVVVVAVIAMVGTVFGQSVLRVVADKNLFGANELATFLLVWVGFISGSLATRDRKHIVVDAVPKLLGDRPAALFLNAAVFLATGVFVVFVLFAGIEYMNSPGVQFRTSTALQLPMKYVVVGLPISLSVMSIRFLQIALEELAIALGAYPGDRRRAAVGLDDLIKSADAPEEPNS